MKNPCKAGLSHAQSFMHKATPGAWLLLPFGSPFWFLEQKASFGCQLERPSTNWSGGRGTRLAFQWILILGLGLGLGLLCCFLLHKGKRDRPTPTWRSRPVSLPSMSGHAFFLSDHSHMSFHLLGILLPTPQTSGLFLSSFKPQLKYPFLWEAVTDLQGPGSLWPPAFGPLKY